MNTEKIKDAINAIKEHELKISYDNNTRPLQHVVEAFENNDKAKLTSDQAKAVLEQLNEEERKTVAQIITKVIEYTVSSVSKKKDSKTALSETTLWKVTQVLNDSQRALTKMLDNFGDLIDEAILNSRKPNSRTERAGAGIHTTSKLLQIVETPTNL